MLAAEVAGRAGVVMVDTGTAYPLMLNRDALDLPPGREVEPSPEAVQAIEAVLEAHNVPYLKAKTWTTDAPYRETLAKIARPPDQRYACSAVHSAFDVGFDNAKITGRSFNSAISRSASSVNVPGMPVAPTSTCGRNARIAPMKSIPALGAIRHV